MDDSLPVTQLPTPPTEPRELRPFQILQDGALPGMVDFRPERVGFSHPSAVTAPKTLAEYAAELSNRAPTLPSSPETGPDGQSAGAAPENGSESPQELSFLADDAADLGSL